VTFVPALKSISGCPRSSGAGASAQTDETVSKRSTSEDNIDTTYLTLYLSVSGGVDRGRNSKEASSLIAKLDFEPEVR
jgi:hypothetical protein